MKSNETVGIEEGHSRGAWMQTYTGGRFFPLDPNPEEVCIEDIAQALSNQTRFNGHLDCFYSVAQHSVLVSRLCSERNRLTGLLHDATEAYVGDMIRPLKLYMPEYKEVEKKVWKAITKKFNLPEELPKEVHHFDMVVCAAEKRDLFGNSGEWPKMPSGDLVGRIEPSSPFEIKRTFLKEFWSLYG